MKDSIFYLSGNLSPHTNITRRLRNFSPLVRSANVLRYSTPLDFAIVLPVAATSYRNRHVIPRIRQPFHITNCSGRRLFFLRKILRTSLCIDVTNIPEVVTAGLFTGTRHWANTIPITKSANGVTTRTLYS